jgi:citrate lyase subunit beta/citryl-CoA lyase
MAEFAAAGRQGKDVRSDCWVRIEPKASGGIRLTLNSKVETMYGKSIRKLVRDELAFFDVKDAAIAVKDSGALPFVLMARIEAAVKRLNPKEKREYLPDLVVSSQPELNTKTRRHEGTSLVPWCLGGEARTLSRERFRRSRLYLPGNEPKFMINAGIHKPDGVILDLEDSVAPVEKDAALILVRNALRQIDFMGAERMVRINQLPRGLAEIGPLVAAHVEMILIPKCESPEMVKQVAAQIQKAKKAAGWPGEATRRDVWLLPIVESCLGVFRALEIARASPLVAALTIGLEDYTADLGTPRTQEARESFWARSQIVNAARAAGVQPIDTVFSDIADMEGLRLSVLEAKGLGFEGKGCIHPRQIPVIHEAFAPTDPEIQRAQKIVLAYRDAEAKGLGAVALGSKMIDPPVVKRALRTVDMATRIGKLAPDWSQPQMNTNGRNHR